MESKSSKLSSTEPKTVEKVEIDINLRPLALTRDDARTLTVASKLSCDVSQISFFRRRSLSQFYINPPSEISAMGMSKTRVQVTFSAPLIFLSSDQWTQIHTAISAQFPLRDAIWKSSFRPAIRTIQELDVDLVGLETIRDELTSQVPQTLLDKPFLNLYIVTCDVLCSSKPKDISTSFHRTQTCTRIRSGSRSRIGMVPWHSERTRSG